MVCSVLTIPSFRLLHVLVHVEVQAEPVPFDDTSIKGAGNFRRIVPRIQGCAEQPVQHPGVKSVLVRGGQLVQGVLCQDLDDIAFF